MNELITVVATTYFPDGKLGVERYAAMSQTLMSWEKYLQYSGDLKLIMSDDGSAGFGRPTYFKKTLVQHTSQKRQGVGASLNKGFTKAFETSHLVAYFVDDWALTEPFDLTPWAQLLMEREDVGVVRLGPPHPNTRGTVEMFTENWNGWGLRLDRYSYAFGTRPALYHKRFYDYYGAFQENTSALDCEKDYAERFASDPKGPDIVLSLHHPWEHIDTSSLSGLTPEGN